MIRRLLSLLTLLSLLLGGIVAGLWGLSCFGTASLAYGSISSSQFPADCLQLDLAVDNGNGWICLIQGHLVHTQESLLGPAGFDAGFDRRRHGVAHYVNRSWLGFGSMRLEGSPYRGAGLLFPLWAPFLLSVLLPAAQAYARVKRRRQTAAGACPCCGYDLRATPDQCPECGKQMQNAE